MTSCRMEQIYIADICKMLDDFPWDISNRYTGLGAGRIIIHMRKAIAIGLASNIIENGKKQRTVTVLFFFSHFPPEINHNLLFHVLYDHVIWKQ